MSSRRPHVLTTYSGRQLDLDNCTPEAIFIDDIAGALSKICRFGAQARRFYSVAQHAVLVQRIVIEDAGRRDLAMAALHHDSHEAYAGDIPSPLKAKLDAEAGGVYDRLCTELDRVIARALGFAFPAKGSADYTVLKEADRRALLIEAAVLLHDGGDELRRQHADKGHDLPEPGDLPRLEECLTPEPAEAMLRAAHAGAR